MSTIKMHIKTALNEASKQGHTKISLMLVAGEADINNLGWKGK